MSSATCNQALELSDHITHKILHPLAKFQLKIRRSVEIIDENMLRWTVIGPPMLHLQVLLANEQTAHKHL